MGGHKAVLTRIEKGSSGLNNMKISDMQARIQATMNKKSNKMSAADLSDPNAIPLDPLDVRSPKKAFDGLLAGTQTSLSKDQSYYGIKQVFTRDHVERTTKVGLKDPFRKNYLTYESEKSIRLQISLVRKQAKTDKLKYDSE